MNYLLMLLSVCASSSKSLLSKSLNEVSHNQNGLSISNSLIFSSALCTVLGFSVITEFGSFSLLTVILSIMYACAITTGQLLYMRALARGTVSITAFIYSCGFLLPTIAGIVFWHESLTVTKTIGLLLLLCSFFLIAWNQKRTATENPKNNDTTSKWKLCAFLAMIMSGILGILQKVHQMSEYKSERTAFLVLAMSGALLLSIIHFFISKKTQPPIQYSKKLSVRAILCGLMFGSANIINLGLSGRVPATIQFPLVNGGTIILTALLGHLLYHEHLSWSKRFGIIAGILAIILISR